METDPDWLIELREQKAKDEAEFAGHLYDTDDFHDGESCRTCLEAQTVTGDCRCGTCCRRMIIEVDLEDAKREPKIAELGSPIYDPPEITGTGQKELAGYLLNSREDMACIFLDRQTNHCTIYDSRPLTCRLFDCAGEGREKLIELGIIERDG